MLFQIRHDAPKLARMKVYLGGKSAHQKWKDGADEADDQAEVEQMAIHIENAASGQSSCLSARSCEWGYAC